MTVSTAIRQHLKAINKSQNELAMLLETNRQNIWNKLNRDNFSAQELVAICKVLNLKLCLCNDNNEVIYTIDYD